MHARGEDKIVSSGRLLLLLAISGRCIMRTCRRWTLLVIVLGLNACWSVEESKPRLIVRSHVIRQGDQLTVKCEINFSTGQYFMNLQHKPFNGKEFSDVHDQHNQQTNLESGSGHRYRLSSELTVEKAKIERDSGQYRCFVDIVDLDQTIEGSPESVFVVGSHPLILLKKKAPLLVKQGNDLNITCVGVSPIEWIRANDEEVQSGAVLRGDLQQSYVISGPLKIPTIDESKQIYRRILHVHNVTCAQAGRYVCRASVNSNDSATSDAAGEGSRREVTKSFSADVVDIFIRDSDQLLVHSAEQVTQENVVRAPAGEPMLLPCVACHQNANISLVRVPASRSTLTSQDNVTWGDPVENVTRVEFVHYDPWRGFIVRGLTGRFACQALLLSDHLQPQYLFFRLEAEGQVESATGGDKPESATRKGLTTVYIAAITCFIVLFLVVVTIIVGCKMLKRNKSDHEEVEKFLSQSQGDYNPELPIHEQTGCVPYDPKWEFPEERLRMGMILGQGAFGRVVKAEAVGIGDSHDVITVAVKLVKDCTNKEQMMALVSELKILIHIGHHLNVVNLLGAVTKDLRYGKLSIIVEYCPFGCLQNYLLKNKNSLRDIPDVKRIEDKPKPKETRRYGPVSRVSPRPNYINQGVEPAGPPLTITNLLCWAFQVCRGMEYLASRKYVHRDLAARNVLLAANNVVKICDFGLARDVYRNAKYYKKREGPVPIKWMALESLTHGLYTTKSDVWSFGIFLWELFSLGGNPYPGVDTATSDFLDLLDCGYRMATPKLAPAELYAVMRQTWDADPLKRPSFSQLVPVMATFLETSATQHYLNLSSPGSLNLPGLGIQEKDGYLQMSSLSQYVPMSPTSTCPPANLLADTNEESDKDTGSVRYTNSGELTKVKVVELGDNPQKWRLCSPDDVTPEVPPDLHLSSGGFEMNARQAIGDHSDGCLPITLSETDHSAHGRPSTSDGYSTLKAKTTNVSDSLDSVFLKAGKEYLPPTRTSSYPDASPDGEGAAEDSEMVEFLRNPIVSDRLDNGAHYFRSDMYKVKNLPSRGEKMAAKMGDSETASKMSDFLSHPLDFGVNFSIDNNQLPKRRQNGHVIYFSNKRTHRCSHMDAREEHLLSDSNNNDDDCGTLAEDLNDDSVFFPDVSGTSQVTGTHPTKLQPQFLSFGEVTSTLRRSLDSGHFSVGSPPGSSPDSLSIYPSL